MNISKVLFVAALLSTSTLWAQPDEYLEVEDSPTSMTALFDDTEAKPAGTMMASVEEVTTTTEVAAAPAPAAPVTAPKKAKKATRGIASVPNYDCAVASNKIDMGQTLPKNEMAAYNKNCK